MPLKFRLDPKPEEKLAKLQRVRHTAYWREGLDTETQLKDFRLMCNKKILAKFHCPTGAYQLGNPSSCGECHTKFLKIDAQHLK